MVLKTDWEVKTSYRTKRGQIDLNYKIWKRVSVEKTSKVDSPKKKKFGI